MPSLDLAGIRPSELEKHRSALTAYCYRMLGSAFDAEDAVQETMMRAWKGSASFEGRSALHSWMHRIATNVCFDMLDGRARRLHPVSLSAPANVFPSALAKRPDADWIEPMPDAALFFDSDLTDPSVEALRRESVRLAFVAALQYLSPRQRSVLILREVLAFEASEVAEILESSVPSVNSLLQRARATLEANDLSSLSARPKLEQFDVALLERYIAAFESYDITALKLLLREDACMSMPPYELWLQGREIIGQWLVGPGAGCRGSKLMATKANGCVAFAQYRLRADGQGHDPWALQVLEFSEGRIAAMTFFLDTARFFPLFQLPMAL